MDIESAVDEIIDPADLKALADRYTNQVSRGSPSAAAEFAYAHGLIRSSKSNVKKGITHLEDLFRRDSEDLSKRDYVYYLAVAHTRLKEYDRALVYIDILMRAESNNRQVQELNKLIRKRMRNDAFLGAAVIGGGVAVIGGLIAAAFMASKRN